MDRLIGKDEVKRILGTPSDDKAYAVIRSLNEEQRNAGRLTIRGRVSKSYLMERYGLTAEEEGEMK
jgi:hypothetical protein